MAARSISSSWDLQIVWYNAEPFRNNLGHKGLAVIRSRFVYRLFCFLTAFAVIGTPAHSSAAVKSSTSKKTVTTTAKKPAVRKTTSATVKRSATGTRRVRAARVRAAQQAAALRDALEPRFKFDETGNVVPDIRAEAAIIYDPENGKVLWESSSMSSRSIASITKVMRAVVILENSPDLTREVVVERADVRAASTTYLRAGYKVT